MNGAPPHSRSFASSDPLEAREFVERVYGGPRLRLLGARSRRWKVTLTQFDVGQLTVCELSVPGELAFQVGTHREEVVIETVLDGAADIDHGWTTERYACRDVFVGVRPDTSLHSRTHSLRVHTVALPVSLLMSVAGADPDRPVVLTQLLGDAADAGGASRWRMVTRHLDQLLADPDAHVAPLVIGPLERLLAATALSFLSPAVVRRRSAGDDRDVHPAVLRRAISYIDAQPDLDIGLADIARGANTSPRAVHRAFCRHLDTTPMAYLRQVRLHHAHEQLRAATRDDGLTVKQIALGWGFASASHFAQEHQAAYGEAPGAVLARED